MGVDVVLGKAGDMSELGIYECYRVGPLLIVCFLHSQQMQQEHSGMCPLCPQSKICCVY